MKQRGFTLIEIMIVLAILGILAAIAPPAIFGSSQGNTSISWGINGATESRCIDGYKFVIGQDGSTRQVLSEFGKGVPCGNPDPGKIGTWGSR